MRPSDYYLYNIQGYGYAAGGERTDEVTEPDGFLPVSVYSDSKMGFSLDFTNRSIKARHSNQTTVCCYFNDVFAGGAARLCFINCFFIAYLSPVAFFNIA